LIIKVQGITRSVTSCCCRPDSDSVVSGLQSAGGGLVGAMVAAGRRQKSHIVVFAPGCYSMFEVNVKLLSLFIRKRFSMATMTSDDRYWLTKSIGRIKIIGRNESDDRI
jgi:hypothetical protein